MIVLTAYGCCKLLYILSCIKIRSVARNNIQFKVRTIAQEVLSKTSSNASFCHIMKNEWVEVVCTGTMLYQVPEHSNCHSSTCIITQKAYVRQEFGVHFFSYSMEVTRRRGRRRKKLLDDLKDRRGYSHLKEETLDRTMWRNRFGKGFGPVIRQNTGGGV